MHYQTLTLTVEDRCATVMLNRPAVRNAFDETLIAELTDAFTKLGSGADVRAIVLAADGPTFCAGADLNWMRRTATFSAAENRADAVRLATMLHTIDTCPKPVIARVQGDCFGGGVGLVSVCDIAVAVDGARFALSEVKLGLIPATISPFVLQAIGARAARRYFLTAELFDTRTAHRLGLVHELVSAAMLDDCIASLLKSLCANGPNAVVAAKELVRDVSGKAVDGELLNDLAHSIATLRASDEGRERVGAFLDRTYAKVN